AGVFHGLSQVEGMRHGRGGALGLRARSGSVGDGFEVVDLGGGNVDKAGSISIDVQASDGADDFAALVADGEAVAEDGGIGRGRGKRSEREKHRPECELDRLGHRFRKHPQIKSAMAAATPQLSLARVSRQPRARSSAQAFPMITGWPENSSISTSLWLSPMAMTCSRRKPRWAAQRARAWPLEQPAFRTSIMERSRSGYSVRRTVMRLPMPVASRARRAWDMRSMEPQNMACTGSVTRAFSRGMMKSMYCIFFSSRRRMLIFRASRCSRTMAPLLSLSKVRTVWPRKSCMAVTNSRQTWRGMRSRWKVSPARERVT